MRKAEQYNDDLLNHLVIPTKLYTAQFRAKSQPTSFFQVYKWRDADKAEMKTFLAIILHTGLVKLAITECY